MQYNNPKFNVGDVLVCVDTERSGLTLGAEYLATYAKKSTKDINGGMITLSDGRVYFGKRFVLKSTLTNKEQVMNSMVVSDLTPKKQRKLAALLVNRGYECSGDLELEPNLLVNFNAKSFCVNFGSYSESLSDRTYITATDKKYKAILAEVLAALPVETPEPVVEPKLELKVGSKVRCVSTNNPEYFAVGAVGVWGDHRKITFTNDYWYKAGAELEVVPDDTPVTTDQGDLPLAFEVGCTVERTDGAHEGMEVGATSVVTALKEDGRHVELEDYPWGHSKRMLKVIKGA